MKNALKMLQFGFVPRNSDLSLLLLRLCFGGGLAALHGWSKLSGFSQMAAQFPDPLGVGHKVSLGLTVFSEFFCAIFIAAGFLTRFAAAVTTIQMAVAFFMIHKHVLMGKGSGEMAVLYMAVFLALFIAGPGKYSVDANLSPGSAGKSG